MAQDFDGGMPRSSGPSEKQLTFITTLQGRLKMTDDQLAEAITKLIPGKTSVLELGRMEASELIDDLLRQAEEAGVDTSPQTGPASEKQVKFIKSLKRRAKLDDAGFAKLLQEVAGVATPEAVGKKEASAVIDKLLTLAGETPKPQAPRGGGRYPPRGGAKGAAPSRGPSRAPAESAPAGGAAPDERPPDRADEAPPAPDDEDLPF